MFYFLLAFHLVVSTDELYKNYDSYNKKYKKLRQRVDTIMNFGFLIRNSEIIEISRERKYEEERTSDWKDDPSVYNFISCITAGFIKLVSSSLLLSHFSLGFLCH